MFNKFEKNYLEELIDQCSFIESISLHGDESNFHKKIRIDEIFINRFFIDYETSIRLLNTNDYDFEEHMTIDQKVLEHCLTLDSNNLLVGNLIDSIDNIINYSNECSINESTINQKERNIRKTELDRLPNSIILKEENNDKNTIEVIDCKQVIVNNSYNLNASAIFVNQPLRNVILSSQGCGKSTFVKRISLAFAKQDSNFLKQYFLQTDLFPVLLNCKEFNNEVFLESYEFVEILYRIFCKQYYSICDGLNLSDFYQWIRNKASSGALLLIFDGFDEIVSLEKKNVFVKAFYDYLYSFPKMSVIFTSSPKSFQNNLNYESYSIKLIKQIPGMKINILEYMNHESMENFVIKWGNALLPSNINLKALSKNIIEQLRTSSNSLKELLYVPAHLFSLLEEFIFFESTQMSVIATSEKMLTAKLNILAKFNIDLEDIRAQLAYIAYNFMKKRIKRMSHIRLHDLLLRCHYDLGAVFVQQFDEKSIDLLINIFQDTIGILRKYDIKGSDFSIRQYSFFNNSMRNYLAAFAIARGLLEDLEAPIVLIKRYYKFEDWHEVVVLVILLVNRVERLQIIDFLINEIRLNRDNYSANNILFDLVSKKIIIPPEVKHRIYDSLFREDLITDKQITELNRYLFEKSSEDLKQYIVKRFNDKKSEINCYSYINAIIISHKYKEDGINPLKEAERLVLSHNNKLIFTGLTIFEYLGRSKYMNIEIGFKNEVIKLSYELGLRMQYLLIEDSILYQRATSAFKSMVLADFIIDYSFIEIATYNKIVEFINEREKCKFSEIILSVFPINYLTLSYCYIFNIKELSISYLEIYREWIKLQDKANDIVFLFSICLLLGCWNITSSEHIKEFINLESYYYKNQYLADNASLTRLKILRKQLLTLGDPISVGIQSYHKRDYEMAKAAFTIAFSSSDNFARNNLAFMLRRGYIKEVVIEGKNLSVLDLLISGISSMEPFALVNYAIYNASQGNSFEYNEGLKTMRLIDLNLKNEIDYVLDWWKELADQGEVEGLIVLAWLIEIGFTCDLANETLDELKSHILI